MVLPMPFLLEIDFFNCHLKHIILFPSSDILIFHVSHCEKFGSFNQGEFIEKFALTLPFPLIFA